MDGQVNLNRKAVVTDPAGTLNLRAGEVFPEVAQ